VTSNADPLIRLQTALDALTNALESGRTDAVLAVEPAIAEAVRDLERAAPSMNIQDRAETRRQILKLRLTIFHCAAIGQAVGDLAVAMQPSPSYGRQGQTNSTAAGHRVEARV
jgi:hypothetical protein